MPETAGEYVDIPALLKGILNGYPGSSAIFREYLQNSDDAKATSQIFILDERVYPSEKLVDSSLNGSQGPAFVAINDGTLEPADWTALQRIHSSSKALDESRTGKNGLGFRASYHLTENPHLLSDRRLVILDAHRQFKPHAGGVSLDFIDEGPNYPDQLAPFIPFLNHPASPYPGTIFRFPLRTETQARTSRIKDTSTPVADVLELLEKFCSDEAEEVILFLKYIKRIEVKHFKRDGTEARIGMVEVENTGTAGEGTAYQQITVTRRDGGKSSRIWCRHRLTADRGQASEVMKARLGYDVGSRLQVEKLSAIVELSFPLSGPPAKGRLYTLLPLPISTGFPIHLNSTFALTPDRQSLKNSLEVGGQKSRERFLVEWNRAVFDLWAPAAWAGLLLDLVRTDEHGSLDIKCMWSIWPPQQLDKEKYWADLPHNLIIEILRRRLVVFPAASRDDLPVSHVSLHDPLILLAGSNPGIPLSALASLDVQIVQPPQHLFSIITSLQSNFKASILSPQTLYERLIKTYSEPNIPPCTEDDIHVITGYLASITSQPTISFIRHVPWFSCTNNSRVALGSMSKNFVVPSTEEESILFSNHPRMLSWGSMSRALHAHVSQPANFATLNVSTLKTDDIVIVLKTKFRHLQPKQSEIKEADHQWLVMFWTWMSKWPKLDDFFRTSLSKCADLYVLPTDERSLRKLSSHSFVFRNTSAAAVEAWSLLGVVPLNSKLSGNPASMMKPVVEVPQTPGYAPLLLRSCDVKAQPRLSQDALYALQESLFHGLPKTARFSLSTQESSRLAAMQVFRTRSRIGDEHKLGSVRGRAIYVKVDNVFALPVQPDIDDAIYVDMSDGPTAKFVQLVNAEPPYIHCEIDFLGIAFDHWELQSAEGKDGFIHWLFEHISEASQDLISRLRKIPFVEVKGVGQRVAPIGLIDPTSVLAKLYVEEAGKFPSGAFCGKYLPVMRSLGFLDSNLDPTILGERLEYLSSSANDPYRFRKAKKLLDLLNLSWDPQFKDLVVSTRSKSWMPLESNSTSLHSLVSPHQCRDQYTGRGKHENPFYYDLALRILPADIQISLKPFREALGWLNVIHPEVLVRQFRLTVDLEPNSERNERLMALIHYLGSLHHEHKLSSSMLDDLVNLSTNRSWIPISKYGKDTVETQFALISPDVDLKPPFFHVENFQYPAFLEEMGCTPRPKLEVLVDELLRIDFQTAKGVSASVLILQEIADEHPAFKPGSILIPGDNDEGLPLHKVFFRDIRFVGLSGGMIDLIPAHNSISPALAESLGIPFLSSLMLEDSTSGHDDPEEEEQMSEDFVNRIQGFLREYDVRYALNEFLANADDAQASEFSLLLDTPTNIGERFLSSAFQQLAGCARLVLHNNATFSDADFDGLRHVGLGGKRGLANIHGRHGLGALSFYYFTDVVTVISGKDIMFLDPSGKYLPPLRRRKRTALKRTIDQVAKQFPDQLKAYESLFKFKIGTSFYDGTLFILPLKSSISETPCTLIEVHEMIKSTYLSSAANAFFFTRLRSISAYEGSDSVSGHDAVWSFSATRQAALALGDGFTRHNLTIEQETGPVELATTGKWLITTSNDIEIPKSHETTAHGLNLSTETPLCVQLAVKTDNVAILGSTTHSSLFSTLRLPKSTSLPFHVNTRFAISSNRQSVVLLPAGSDNQLDPKSAYNVWILNELVPKLYLATLDHLVHGIQRKHFYRDIWWLLNSDDDISTLVCKPFLELLVGSKRLLFQDGGHNWLPFCDTIFSASQPSQVTDLLTLIKAPNFAYYEHLKGMANHKGAKIVDGGFVKRTLAAIGLKAIQGLYKDKKVGGRDIARIMDYVRKEDGLERLPLLILSSGELVEIPDKTLAPIYRPTTPAISALFSAARFMSHDYTQESLKRLIDEEAINILDFTKVQIVALIRGELDRRDSVSQAQWLELFWRSYFDLPVRPELSSLEDLKIVQGSSRTLRLSECTSNLVIYQSERHSTIDQSILAMLQKFDFEIVSVTNRPILDDYLAPKFTNTLTNILQCMESKGIFNLGVLTAEESQTLAAWMRDTIFDAISYWHSSGKNVTFSFLRQVSIWIGQTNERQFLHSTMGMKILPPNFTAEHIRPFQKAGVVLAPHSYSLIRFLQYMSSCDTPPKVLSAKAITDCMDFPLRIALDDAPRMQSMKSFISSMFILPTNEVKHARLQVPDRQGNLQLIDELYDDEVLLFATTLNYTDPPSFVHTSFRSLHSRLHDLGLHHQINPVTFATCARAIYQALQLHAAGTLERNLLLQMSDAAFDVYQTSLPSMVMIDQDLWSSIDAIGFVRRKDIRRQGATYDVNRYFDEPLPLLLPPSRFVRQSMEAIAWTQRALFYQEPSEEVVALNKTIGVPTATEVIKHLKVLAMRIAPDHHNNVSVIDDLKATYSWLNEHIDDAREVLEDEAVNLPLFLNVNDPLMDIWHGHWLRAEQMVLGLHYNAGGLKRVGRFLQEFDKLLKSFGCISLRVFERGPRAAPTQDVAAVVQDMRATYNEMRRGGELTDVALVPSTADDQGAAVNDPELRAHLSFLAATIPYVRRSAQGWSVSTTGKITFYGSSFGAKALLDFAYTGDFQRPTPDDDVELAKLLNHLLELLPITDEWDLPQLKQTLEYKIIHKYDMIQKLPHQYHIMVEQAERYKAESLKKALSEFKKANEDFLRVLQDTT